MKTFSFSDLNRHPGEVLDAALAEPVTLTRHGKAKLVVMPIESWKILRHGRSFAVADAPEEVVDVLLEALSPPRGSGT